MNIWKGHFRNFKDDEKFKLGKGFASNKWKNT